MVHQHKRAVDHKERRGRQTKEARYTPPHDENLDDTTMPITKERRSIVQRGEKGRHHKMRTSMVHQHKRAVDHKERRGRQTKEARYTPPHDENLDDTTMPITKESGRSYREERKADKRGHHTMRSSMAHQHKRAVDHTERKADKRGQKHTTTRGARWHISTRERSIKREEGRQEGPETHHHMMKTKMASTQGSGRSQRKEGKADKRGQRHTTAR
jgi:hypothetical protein